jgi:Protein of unknwon function (DUF3310)
MPAGRRQIWSARKQLSEERVNHPAHYGDADRPYEAIMVIEAWRGLGYNLGNAVKYISRAGKRTPANSSRTCGRRPGI